MTWLVWRQHRHQAYLAAAALAVFAAVMLASGRSMAAQYASALTSCTRGGSCASLASSLHLGSPVMSALVTLTVVVPCLLGVFWGGPLVAREAESGTTRLAWLQGVTRGRWLTAQAGWALLAAAVWGGAVAALVTWWSGPLNALQHQNFQPSQFDIQGVVPVGYALFAVALGIAAGAILRRTLPAMAVTLVLFTLVRLVVGEDLRSRFLAPVTRTFSFGPGALPRLAGSYWETGGGIIGPGGHIPAAGPAGPGPQLVIDNIPVSPASLPAACRNLTFASGPPQKLFSCLSARGYHGFISYQPAGRYWVFQGIETGIFVLLAALLLTVAAVVVLRRDA